MILRKLVPQLPQETRGRGELKNMLFRRSLHLEKYDFSKTKQTRLVITQQHMLNVEVGSDLRNIGDKRKVTPFECSGQFLI